MKYPNKFKELVESFQLLPGIGPKNAERLAYYCIDGNNKENAKHLSKSIDEAVDSIKECSECGMITDENVCEICSDYSRENKIMIVESAKDVIAFEKTNAYKGYYHILKGIISPANGVGPDDIKIDELEMRIKNHKYDEIIIATSSNIDGEITAMYLSKVLAKTGIKIYRIGYGLPVSTNIEFVDEITLIKSLESKKEM